MQKIMPAPVLKNQSVYNVTGTLWIECDGERFFGPGRVELLQNIDKTGSIKKAAALMNMSYKKAWEMISSLNNQGATPFVIKQSGGEKGGGSALTDEARQMIAYHAEMRIRFKAFLENETKNFNASTLSAKKVFT